MLWPGLTGWWPQCSPPGTQQPDARLEEQEQLEIYVPLEILSNVSLILTLFQMFKIPLVLLND